MFGLMSRAFSCDSYRAYLADLIETDWAVASVAAAVAAWAELIRSHVAADPTAFYTASQFETNLRDDIVDRNKRYFGLESFNQQRVQFIQQDLAQ